MAHGGAKQVQLHPVDAEGVPPHPRGSLETRALRNLARVKDFQQRRVHDQELARYLAEGVLEEAIHVFALESPLLLEHQQLPLQGDAAHDREVIARKLLVDDGRLAHRGVGAHDGGKQVEAAPIHEYCRPALPRASLFSCGQRFSLHSRMASSSRWSTRRSGFCKEKPSLLRIRLTCAGWWLTPNSLLISWATLWHVHTSPLNPCATAPFSNNPGSLAR